MSLNSLLYSYSYGHLGEGCRLTCPKGAGLGISSHTKKHGVK